MSKSNNHHVSLDATWLTDSENIKLMEGGLAQYFGRSSEGGANFSGQYFGRFVGISTLERFTAFDVLAAESLSVDVPAEVAYGLVRPDPDRDDLLWEFLRDFSKGQTLWDCDLSLLDDEGHLSQLYLKLKDQKGSCKMTTSKLLATKFSNVVPIPIFTPVSSGTLRSLR